MKPSDPTGDWLDRKKAMLDLDAPFAQKVAAMDDDRIIHRLGRGLSVVAFDPGGTTGWSIMRVDPAKLLDKTVRPHETITQWHHGEIDCGAKSGQVANSAAAQGIDLGGSASGEAAGVFMMERLIRLGGRVPCATVVIEDFILRTQSQKRDAISPVRLISSLDTLLWIERIVPEPVKQQPSEAKTTITDERLKQWGLWASGSRHARDADRHALLFIRKVREQRAKVFRAWPLLKEAIDRGLLQL
ncbi:RuvC-like resolvase [Gordonia phage NatB6]|uniref:RuvC-like resolvase n=1 Tax=Gordonia phage NatB6 TaxID=2250322 RepID=A0A345L4Y5_9CAUD|nr:RuvC-like resolvase [Gordonia phage NatB6]AXH50337.1 RuvC-like resolvase [Gordonia phage NatB6]